MTPPRPYSKWRRDPNGRWRDAFHTFGYLLITHARDDALGTIPSTASKETRAIATKAAERALYNVMMILEGVVVPQGENNRLEFALTARVLGDDPSTFAEQIEIAPGGVEAEPITMGFHLWTQGDFRR